ncbi:MAG: hypothetical protein MJY67_00910 [Bacteroidales bacterium]|nr:hypothetical protein [Bacteroidales bacterium]
MKRIIILSLATMALIFSACSCDKTKTHSTKKDKGNIEFESAYAEDYGDFYANGTRNVLLTLTNGTFDEDGYLEGEGEQIILDINCKTSSTDLPAGFYTCTTDQSETFAFNAGSERTYTLREELEEYEQAGFEIDWSEYTEAELNEKYTSPEYSYYYVQEIEGDDVVYDYSLITDGSLEIARTGATYTISGEFSMDGKVVKFSYKGEVPVYDESYDDEPGGDTPGGSDPGTGDTGDRSTYETVDMGTLPKAHLISYGQAYEGVNYNDWEIYLGGSDMTVSSGAIGGKSDYAVIEVITPASQISEISAGTFKCVSELSVASLVPGALIPYYEDGDYAYGSMLTQYFDYQGTTDHYITAGATDGSATVKRDGDKYTIEFTLYDDDYGVTFSGKFTGVPGFSDYSSAASSLSTKSGSPYKWYHLCYNTPKKPIYVVNREQKRQEKIQAMKVVKKAKKLHIK